MNKLLSLFLIITCITNVQTMNAYKYYIRNYTKVDLAVQIKVGTADRATQQQGTISVPADDNKIHGPLDIGGSGAGLALYSVGVKPYGSKGDYSTMGFPSDSSNPWGDFLISIYTDGKYFWYHYVDYAWVVNKNKAGK